MLNRDANAYITSRFAIFAPYIIRATHSHSQQHIWQQEVMRCISRAITVNRDVTNSWNSVPILNDTPTKVNLDQSYFRASISAVQCGCWSCGVKLVKTGRWTTSKRPDFTCLLLLYKQTRSTTRDDARKSLWPRLAFVGAVILNRDATWYVYATSRFAIFAPYTIRAVHS